MAARLQRIEVGELLGDTTIQSTTATALRFRGGINRTQIASHYPAGRQQPQKTRQDYKLLHDFFSSLMNLVWTGQNGLTYFPHGLGRNEESWRWDGRFGVADTGFSDGQKNRLLHEIACSRKL
jgi:hypothetical protein